MSDIVRTPVQKRSIDKKNRIVEAGYRLFAEKGYHNTNTAEIAKEAGVSTGIVYGYFRDKRDILVDVLEIYVNNVFTPIFDLLGEITPPVDLDALIPTLVDRVVEVHAGNAAIHDTLHSMTPTDEAVRLKFMSLEDDITERMAGILASCGFDPEGLNEKVHLAMQVVNSYAHECVYDKHDYIDYGAMRDLVIRVLKKIFEG